MSRVGRKPVTIPSKVNVAVAAGLIKVSGPLGNLEQALPEGVDVAISDGVATVSAPKPNRSNRGYQGLVRALLANMVEGVTKGYERSLSINGVGYKAEHAGDSITFSLGYTHPIKLNLPKGISAEVDKQQTTVKIKGIDKQLVGQIAAQIRAYKIPEPYKAKGVKYTEETIRRKVGKAGAK